MPTLSKKSLSLFLRIGCERQFILSLYTGKIARADAGMPFVEPNRAGLGLVGRAGYTYQETKVSELADLFRKDSVRIGAANKNQQPKALELLDELPKLKPYQFLIEGRFDADTPEFRQAIGVSSMTDLDGRPVNIAAAQPDILQLLPPLKDVPLPAVDARRDPTRFGVEADGGLTALAPTDHRIRLRIIDVKLASEPGAHYFAEVVYYSMALAAWIRAHALHDTYVVVAAPAVWPGSYETSRLKRQLTEWHGKAYTPTPAEQAQLLEAELEVGDVEVFAPRLRELLSTRLPALLKTPWKELDWHVDYRCKGCELLGAPKPKQIGDKQDASEAASGAGGAAADPVVDAQHEDLCWPTAEREAHLSRVVGLTRGASAQLRLNQVSDVPRLAVEPVESGVFSRHQGLRTKRNTFPHRAAALTNAASAVIPDSGGDALMPRWPDLHVHVFVDYDISTAMTAVIGVRAFWVEPEPYGVKHSDRGRKNWPDKGRPTVFVVDDKKDLTRERQEFLRFLNHLREIFDAVIQQDSADSQANRRDKKTTRSTYQIYLWDESQRKHLVRLMGRYLVDVLADKNLRDLAWLFPPPELLQKAEEATRRTPFTLVADVINNTLAVAMPHHYRLIDVARQFAGQIVRPQPQLNAKGEAFDPYFLNDLYQEPMSDLVPAERIHELWEKSKNWLDVQDRLRQTNQTKVSALGDIVESLEKTLGSKLSRQAAPPLGAAPAAVSRLAPQSRVLYEFLRLNVALDELETDHVRAMPPYERAARGKSARLERRLIGAEREAALPGLAAAAGDATLNPVGLWIYALRPDSYELNAKPGDFTYALAPETAHGFLDQNAASLLKKVYDNANIRPSYWNQTVAEAKLTAVTIESIDRVNGTIALRPARDAADAITALEDGGCADFSTDVVLDPTHDDFLISKVRLTLQGIGNPPAAANLPSPLGVLAGPPRGAKRSKDSEAAQLLWNAPAVHAQAVARNIAAIRPRLVQRLQTQNQGLDDSQWQAWELALTRRLTLIWGPPGTGKSHTLRAIVTGALMDAAQTGRALRILVTANTYTAIDNVLLRLASELKQLPLSNPVSLQRVQSSWRHEAPDFALQNPAVNQIVLNASQPDAATRALIAELNTPTALAVVGCAPQQLHNLAVAGLKREDREPEGTLKPWFDLVILDEASQMDVATATLVFTKLAEGGTVVLAGDDLQLPPIHAAEPPDGLEYDVGSSYNYFRHRHAIEPASLDVNYRSNATIVELTKWAGYSAKLKSASPDLALNPLAPPLVTPPTDWPSQLEWDPAWNRLLDPAQPIACFVYDDKLSGQVNEFEAAAVGAIAYLARATMSSQLAQEQRPDGSFVPADKVAYTSDMFWARGLGVVTPHRAQMAKVVQQLQILFPPGEAQGIRSAVDTVERFQGQQRDIIIGSFGVGDPDVIASEDEFLYDLRRFNVMLSRARAKLILFVTRSLLDHLSNDRDVLEESRLLKLAVDSFCKSRAPLALPYVQAGTTQWVTGHLHTA